MRLAPALLAACAAVSAASDSSAADTPPKAEAGKPLRLALKAGRTYVYRLSEKIVIREPVTVTEMDGSPIESRADVVWDVGLTLQRAEAGGDSIVSLMPKRVRGTVTEFAGKPAPFDSEDPKSGVTSPVLERGIRVRLSPRGRVLEVTGPSPAPLAGAGPDVRIALARLGGDFVRPFAEQFFHEVPKEAPKKDLAWEQSRALALEWDLWERENQVVGRSLGDVTESSVVQALSADVVTASLRARGKRDAPRVDEPLDADRMTLADLTKLGDQLDEWLVLGEVRIRRDCGLVQSRTSTTTLSTHMNSMRVPGANVPPIPGLAGDVTSAPSDRTHEISSRLELVEVR